MVYSDIHITPHTFTNMFIFAHITNPKSSGNNFQLLSTVIFLSFPIALLLYIFGCYISKPNGGHKGSQPTNKYSHGPNLQYVIFNSFRINHIYNISHTCNFQPSLHFNAFCYIFHTCISFITTSFFNLFTSSINSLYYVYIYICIHLYTYTYIQSYIHPS